MLAAAGVLLAAWSVAALRRSRRRVAPLAGLELALALAREAQRAAGAGPPARPGTARPTARRAGPRLAGADDDLAWSAPAPTRDALAQLVTEVEHEVDAR